MKDLSFIDKHVAKMKLSHEAIIRQWIRSGKVDLRDLVANVSDIRENVVFLPITRENLPQIKSGMFWYGDDTVSEKLSFTKKLKSLVLLADGDEILGDSFKEETLSWKKAGEFAKNFSNEFISKGEAVWLDVDVLREVEKFEAKINASLRLLQAPEWSGFYWSSTGFYPNFVWYVFFGRGTQDAMKEWDCCKIRPIIRYKVK